MGEDSHDIESLRKELAELRTQNADLKAAIERRDRFDLFDDDIRVLEALATGAELPSVLESLVLLAERAFPGMIGSVLLLDDAKKHLHHGASPSLSSSYTKAIDGLAIGPDIASCGTCAYTGKTVIVDDIENDPRWANFRELALGFELRACWSTPILGAEGEVLGTFALYYRERRAPTDLELNALRRSAHLASLAIRQQRLLVARQSSDRFARSALDALSAHLAIIDDRGTIVAVNEAWRRFAHKNDGVLIGLSEGVNYLEVCDHVSGPEQHDAARMGKGIRDVIRHDRDVFEMEYPCHSPTEQRWFMARVTRFSESPPGAPQLVAIVHDNITQRYRAEEDLRLSEAHFRSVVEAVREGIVVQERDGAISSFNPSAQRILRLERLRGMTSSDPHWQAIREDGSPFPGDQHASMITLRTGQPMNDVVMGLRHIQGSEVWLSINSRPIFAEGETLPIRVVTTFLDITEKRAAETEQRRTAEHLRTMIETEPECVKVIGPADDLLEINPSGLSMLEASSLDEARRKPLPDYVLAEYRAAYIELHDRARRGEAGQLEFELEGLNKTRRWVESHSAPMRELDGSIRNILTVTRDITTRRQAEAALRDSEARLSAIINTAMDAILSLDHSMRIVVFNPAAQSMFGCDRDHAMGQHVDRFIPGAFDPKTSAFTVIDGQQSSRSSGQLRAIQGRRANGELFSIEASFSRSQVKGQTMLTVILRDVTGRDRLQTQLLHARKMESLGRLAGGVAHDFNNLLTVINCFVELATARLEPASEQLLEPLEEIRAASSRAATLTRQLLAFSRRQIVQPTVLQLDALITDMSKMLGRLIGEDVVLDVHLGNDIHRIKADPGQVEQVVMNLVINARDAMPRGGHLHIGVANVDVDANQPGAPPGATSGAYVQLEVVDTGVGMDATVLQHMFDPFFTTKEQGKGTGLGLSTVHGIVSQHNGFIQVESEIGKGTTFRLYFPQAEASTSERSRTEPQLVHTGHESILLVEDEQQLRDVVTRVLKRAGYDVLVASTGDEALRVLTERREPIDLLFTDVVMPGMSGRELAERAENHQPGIKVLYASGYTDDTVLRHGIQTETMQFIAKPYGVSDLFKKIREIFNAS